MPIPAASYTVRRGDNLWKIAASHLRRTAEGNGAGIRTIHFHGYWTELVRTNLPTLSSGNPNLIYSGETLALPPSSGGRG